MPNVSWGWLIVGVALGFALRHLMRGRTAVTS
jgi:hypothetical protein